MAIKNNIISQIHKIITAIIVLMSWEYNDLNEKKRNKTKKVQTRKYF